MTTSSLRTWSAGAAIAALALTCAGTASAQTLGTRMAVEAVAAVASTSDSPDDPWVWLDLAATFRVNDSIDVVVRPYARRLPGGDWAAQLYQAQIQYRPADGVRVDAGIITSPLGLGALELRPDLNPVVTYPFYYFGQLPRFDGYPTEVSLLSGGYPLGAMVSWSGVKWDARAAITDTTPARSRDVFESGPASAPQFIAGGGFTPITGLRFGIGVARGKYRKAGDDFFERPTSTPALTDANATVFNLEGEYAFRYTRLSGEWVRDSFSSLNGSAVARGSYLQVVQTLAPRIFTAARLTHASTPAETTAGLVRRSRAAAEATVGYRLTSELTLKAGYQAARAFGSSDWNHTAVWSLVWTQRF